MATNPHANVATVGSSGAAKLKALVDSTIATNDNTRSTFASRCGSGLPDCADGNPQSLSVVLKSYLINAYQIIPILSVHHTKVAQQVCNALGTKRLRHEIAEILFGGHWVQLECILS